MSASKVAIIGAGISGLACAQALLERGVEVEVFEKSRSLGGRLATRRWEGHVVDHGAPWFVIGEGNPFFEACRDRSIWGREIALIQAPECEGVTGLALSHPSGERCYLPAGNNRLSKLLAPDVVPRMETTIGALHRQPDGRWQAGSGVFDAVVLTAPWPQTSQLLAPWLGDQTGPEPRYARTLTAFFEYGEPPSEWARRWSGMTHDPAGSALAHSICENHKTGRIQPGCTVIVAHATPGFSEDHFDGGRDQWSAVMEKEVRQAWQCRIPPRAVFTHRWGFSTMEAPFAAIPELPRGIYVAGDAVSGPGLGAVYRSGRQVAEAVLA